MSASSTLERLIAARISLGKARTRPTTTEALRDIRELDDETVMALVQRGYTEALGELFDRYSCLIQNVATRVLRDPTEAQDLLQDVFLYVHRKSHVFNPTKRPVASWLLQITYSRAFTRLESLSARAEADCCRIEELADLADTDGPLERLTDALVAKELVQQGLAELTERQQQTLRMYFYEGYSLREISASLNESLTNTRHHYYRGIEKLKDVLKAFLARHTGEGVA